MLRCAEKICEIIIRKDWIICEIGEDLCEKKEFAEER
jgi:hypothetical protein